MTSFYAKPEPQPLNVIFVVYPDIVLLDLAGPLQVFTHAREHDGAPPAYRTHVVSDRGGQIATSTVVSIDTTPLGDWLNASAPLHTLVIVGGDGAIPLAKDAAFVARVGALAARAERVCSVCSGALILAATGALDGRRAVTHWEDCSRLARDYPKVQVEEDPIFIKDGHIWTSAGITAGTDMALAMIQEDLGKTAALDMARSLVTPMVRSGGQSQFSAALARQTKGGGGKFDALHNWLEGNLTGKITVDDMARHCAMSPRNFSRRYTSVMGQPPAKALETLRVEAARTQLATTEDDIKQIARACGFGDDERMRRAFVRVLRTSPSEYRKLFGAA